MARKNKGVRCGGEARRRCYIGSGEGRRNYTRCSKFVLGGQVQEHMHQRDLEANAREKARVATKDERHLLDAKEA